MLLPLCARYRVRVHDRRLRPRRRLASAPRRKPWRKRRRPARRHRPEVTKPDAAPAPGAPPARRRFGEDATLTAKPIIYLKGTGTWDNAFETVTGALKKLKAYADKQGSRSTAS